MQVIYATGQPRFLDFAVTDRRETIPTHAIVFAVCIADRTIENLDEDLFEALTDGEFHTFRGLVRAATACESQRQSTQTLSVDKLVGWLLDYEEIKTTTTSGRPAQGWVAQSGREHALSETLSD